MVVRIRNNIFCKKNFASKLFGIVFGNHRVLSVHCKHFFQRRFIEFRHQLKNSVTGKFLAVQKLNLNNEKSFWREILKIETKIAVFLWNSFWDPKLFCITGNVDKFNISKMMYRRLAFVCLLFTSSLLTIKGKLENQIWTTWVQRCFKSCFKQ